MNLKFGMGALVALALVGCGDPGSSSGSANDAGTQQPQQDAGAVYTPPPDAGFAEGLPCDVYGVLKDDCIMCHGKPLQNNATVRLISRVDLVNPSELYPDQTNALRALARMSAHDSTRMPPPPYSEVPTNDYLTILSWVNNGMPAGTCDPNAPQPTTCTSGSKWIYGDSGSPNMNPGLACIDCHRKHFNAPTLTAAGTVYPSRHEQDTCNGSSSAGGTITVEVIDSDGTVHKTTANSVGNFYLTSSLKFPITARITKNGKTRVMVQGQTSADCNSCHTEQGLNGAPGRIYEP